MTTPIAIRPLVVGLLVVILAAACSSAAGPAFSPGPTQPAPSAGAPSAGPGNGAGGGSSGAPAQSEPDTSIGKPVDPTPVDPGLGQPALVIPRPGQRNPHQVGAAKLEPAVDGHHVLVRVTWWSGVEPCNVLDSVNVVRSDTDITIQLIEGSRDAQAICIEIAQQKATIVDLGELDPGTYTISAAGKGDAVPITVTVS